jgi:hypothetical protein
VGAATGSNAQLARNGNIELMEDVNTGSREIDEIDDHYACNLISVVASHRGRLASICDGWMVESLWVIQ